VAGLRKAGGLDLGVVGRGGIGWTFLGGVWRGQSVGWVGSGWAGGGGGGGGWPRQGAELGRARLCC
jgi:hypothetical protein